jgi:D-alanine-D-alanine ligase
VDATLLPALSADPPLAVVPLLHGAAGEDGALRDVLDALAVPYVCSGPAAWRRAFAKAIAASLVSAAGVAVPDGVTLTHATFRDLGAAGVIDAIGRRLGLPLMVRPTRGGSSLGATVVREVAELPAAMVAAFSYGDTALIQRFVTGTEVAVAVLDLTSGPRALPAVGIHPDGGVYDYTARYTAGATEFVVPADLPQSVLTACAEVATTAHRTLGLADWSRADLIADAEGTVWFLEANVAPGMTDTSTYPLALAAAGRDLAATVLDLAHRSGARSAR